MTTPDPEFESLLEFVRDSRGFDYTGYKRPTLVRRFQKRMDAVGADGYAAYREHLEREPDEFAELFDTILINVTGFFRDPAAWDYLASEVVPRILDQVEGDRQIRVWSAGCASGAEAYTIAIVFAEALAHETLRDRVKIYATDLDDDALRYARHAAYTEKEVKDVPESLRERYFDVFDGHYSFRNGVRRAVVFGRNDLLQDPPISRVDLLVSRNTLMYFGQEAQERILSNFFFALRPRGYLMLGKAEALHSRTSLFEPLDVKRRVFVKNHGTYVEPRIARATVPRQEPDTLLRETAFEQARLAQIVVDLDGRVSAINHAARAMFGLKAADVSQPLQDLQISYRPLDLRSLIDRVEGKRRHVVSEDVTWEAPDGTLRNLDVQVSPLISHGGTHAGVAISFTDITRYRSLQEDLEHARRDVETANEELQSTVEELETTNEELQSTNEELETTNEELQSTNEELETMNEELQSTNEELEAMNDEMRERTDEALHANAFLSSILSSVHQSIIVVDRDLRIAAWSRAAAETWGLREDEVRSEHLLNLDVGIPTEQLRDPIRNVLAGEPQDELVLRGHNRRGQAVECTIAFDPLAGPHDVAEGVILVMLVERV